MKKIVLGGMLAAGVIFPVAAGWENATIYVREYDPGITIEKVAVGKKSSEKGKAKALFSLAVSDFNYHAKQICGRELPVKVVSTPKEIQEPAIVLGSLAAKADPEFRIESESDEAFRIKVSGQRILAGGNSDFGSALAIYELLKQFGCDWVFPGKAGEIIPSGKELALAEMDREFSPAFAVRAPWMNTTRVPEKDAMDFHRWVLRQKCQLESELFHPLKMRGGHVWQKIIRDNQEKFKKDPTMYALIRLPDGSKVRKGPQLESTHPEVLKLTVDYIRAEFKKNKWPNDKKVCIGVGPADSSRYSCSPETLAQMPGRTDPMGGLDDFTDGVVIFANRLLEMTSDEFPNLYLGFYLYNNHADYPLLAKPHPRLSMTIADISFSRYHGLGDMNSKTRHYYRHILEQWKKLHQEQKNIYFFRGYDYNMADCFLPYTKLKVWGEDIPYYHRMGVAGMYNNWSATWAISAPSNYLDVNMEWDISMDWNKVLTDYCRKAYGSGAAAMEQYYRKLTQRQSEAGYEAGSFYSFPLMYDEKWVAEAEKLFDRAAAEAKQDSERERIKLARIPLEMLKYYLAFHREFIGFRFTEAKKEFNKLGELISKSSEAHPLFFEKQRYSERFLRKSTEAGVTYSTTPYRMVSAMPERLKMGFDPRNNGVVLGLFRSEINDRAWPEYSTYASTWDAQGLWGMRSGSVWYRWRFDAPKLKDDEAPGLLLTGVDNIADVWCNNRYLGRGTDFIQPFAFDLSSVWQPGKENILVIRVERFGNSELGSGGIMFPGFIFAGPKLAKPAPETIELEEILPGAGGVPFAADRKK